MDVKRLLDEISGLRDNLHEYLETRVSYYGLTAFEKAVRLFTALTGGLLVLLTLLLSLIFVSTAAASWLGRIWNSTELGLMAVGGFYLLLALFLVLFRKRLIGPVITRLLVTIFFSGDNDNS